MTNHLAIGKVVFSWSPFNLNQRTEVKVKLTPEELEVAKQKLEARISQEAPCLNDTKIYYLRRVGTWPYWKMARNDMLRGLCPFCDPLYESRQEILFQNRSWRVHRNPVKKKSNGIGTHLLVVPKRHLLLWCELTRQELADLADVFDWAKRDYDFSDWGFLGREGDVEGTIRHIHINFMVPDNTKEVRPPLRKSEQDFVLEDGPRCLIFERAWKYERLGLGHFPFQKILLPEDLKLVEDRLEVAA